MARFGKNRYEKRSGSRVLRVLAIVGTLLVSASAASAQVYEVLHDFAGPDFGPVAGLMLATDNNLYGSSCTSEDGSLPGMIFRIDGATNVFSVLYDFPDPASQCPPARLQEGFGEFYGFTGDFSAGLHLFRMDHVGNVSTFWNFGDNTENVYEDAGGMIGVGAYLYGVTAGEGNPPGTMFRMDQANHVVTLHSFSGGVQGVEPSGELLYAPDGRFYGVTRYGGDYRLGTVFSADASGNVTTVHSFAGGSGDGASPSGRLVEMAGKLYGTTEAGGGLDLGTVYSLDISTTPGLVGILHSFAGGSSDGSSPHWGMSKVPGGTELYGTTYSGGTANAGTLFQIDSAGNTTVLHSFGFGDPFDGTGAGPVLAIGNVLTGTKLYGVTRNGGAYGYGTAYVYGPPPGPIVLRLTPTAGPIRVQPGDPVQIHGGIFPVGGVPSVLVGGLPASNVQVLDQENLAAVTPPDLSPGTLNEIIIVMPDGTRASLDKAWMADFLDVPESDRLRPFVERVFRSGLMDGCGGGNFCEGGAVDRATLVTMALKAKHGAAWAPPACTGAFKDVPCPGPQADWVEDAVAEGIAQPCARNKFCPSTDLTRETIADILLKTEHGSDFVPPACTGIFKDVKCPGPNANAIEQLYNEGVVEACATNPLSYCPKWRANRGPVAEYEAKAFKLR